MNRQPVFDLFGRSKPALQTRFGVTRLALAPSPAIRRAAAATLM
jgi:hypothetical protein